MTEILANYLKRTNPAVRFLLVGVINTLTGLSVSFILLTAADFSYWTSTFTGNSTGAVVSYCLNKNFTFRSRIPARSGIPRFIFVILASYAAAYWLGERFAASIGQVIGAVPFPVDETAVLIGACLYTVFNYIGQKFMVFT